MKKNKQQIYEIARIMVADGKARDFYHALSLLGKRGNKARKKSNERKAAYVSRQEELKLF